MEEERKGTQLKVELSVFIICLVGWQYENINGGYCS